MRTPVLFLAVAIVATTPLLVATGPTGAARPWPTVTLAPTAGGCDITVRAHNKSGSNVTIDLEDSEAKVKYGLWKKFNQGGNWVVNTGGEHESQVVNLDLGCDLLRQYKFLMRSGDDDKYVYFPDEDEFTSSVSLGLANVGRHF